MEDGDTLLQVQAQGSTTDERAEGASKNYAAEAPVGDPPQPEAARCNAAQVQPETNSCAGPGQQGKFRGEKKRFNPARELMIKLAVLARAASVLKNKDFVMRSTRGNLQQDFTGFALINLTFNHGEEAGCES